MNTNPTIPCYKCGGALTKGDAARYTSPLQNQYVCQDCGHESWISDEKVAARQARRKKLVRFNFWKSTDDGATWNLAPKEEVPEEIKTDDNIAQMLDGMGAHYQGDVYLALKLDHQWNH